MYKIGLIGYGGFGRFLHQAWAALPEASVCAVADEQDQTGLGAVTFYSEWQDLITDPEIDIVSIATPPHTHAAMACAAMEAGKHVLIEKPLATTLEDARCIVETRDRTGRVAAVDYVLRFNPIVEALQAWSRNGWFGKLRRVTVENYAQDEVLPPEHWFWDERQSGGILVEHAVHFIDLTNACAPGAPTRVEGLSLRRTPQQEDRVLMTVVYAGGLVATQYHEFARPRSFEHTSMRFVFDLAEVDVEGWIPLSGRVRAMTNSRSQDRLTLLPGFRVSDEWSLRREEGAPPDTFRVGGVGYDANTMISGTFALSGDKDKVYRMAVRAVMADLIRAIDESEHRLRVSLEAGMASLKVAVEATRSAHG
jgi:predicted dehydrogenase